MRRKEVDSEFGGDRECVGIGEIRRRRRQTFDGKSLGVLVVPTT